MSISTLGGLLSFAIQGGDGTKVGRGNTFDPDAETWYQIRTGRSGIGAIQDQQVFPLEIGGTLTPTGAFKQKFFFAGTMDVYPRLEDTFAYLAWATMGIASTVTGVNADGDAQVGTNTHIFRFDPALPGDQPWMAVRRMIPGRVIAERLGETGYDCKVTSLSITIPNQGKVVTRVVMTGRDTIFDDADGWTYENDLEASLSTPEVGAGHFLIGGVKYPIIGASVEIDNNLSTPDQEMIVGDFRPDDYIALTRSASIRIVYKYENPELYLQLNTNLPDGTVWDNLPFIKNKDGNGYAVEFRFETPGKQANGEPYALVVRAGSVTFATEGPIQLNPGGYITQTFMGTILQPTDPAEDYLQIVIENEADPYGA